LEKRKLVILFGSSDEDEDDDTEYADVLNPTKREYTPRKRVSKHLEEMQSMATDREKITNVVPSFPSGEIESWEEFDALLKNYKTKYNLKFRVRSSETTASYSLYEYLLVLYLLNIMVTLWFCFNLDRSKLNCLPNLSGLTRFIDAHMAFRKDLGPNAITTVSSGTADAWYA
jgi:hypothetical protein